MKLQTQLSVAFTTLLLVVMALVSYVVYSLILDLLIQDERRQLEQTGEILVDIINQQYSTPRDVEQFYEILREQDLQMLLYNHRQDVVLFSTLPTEILQIFYQRNDFSDASKQIWEYGKETFVTSRITVLPENSGLELILLTSVDDLRQVQQSFLLRLIFVFLIGASIVVLLTYYLTRKLVTPLTLLKWQLKRIEKRQFNHIEQIKATGEIKEVADSFYEMASELERYIHAQQAFFQNASHELKTPLMTIQGYAEGIRDGIFDEEEMKKGLEVMVQEVKRLKKIINEMILLAKLESERAVYEPEKVNLESLITLVVDRVMPIASEKGITIYHQAENNVNVFADKDKMLRAILNVVMNGIRHAATKVDIAVSSAGTEAEIIIEDDGKGIDETVKAHIFHRFVKGKNGETGLGLAITRAIVEQSNGKISAGHSKYGGAKFIITLPISKE